MMKKSGIMEGPGKPEFGTEGTKTRLRISARGLLQMRMESSRMFTLSAYTPAVEDATFYKLSDGRRMGQFAEKGGQLPTEGSHGSVNLSGFRNLSGGSSLDSPGREGQLRGGQPRSGR